MSKEKDLGKPVIISKHLHSCSASWSSGDKMVYFKTNKNLLDFEVDEKSLIKSKAFPHLTGENISEIKETTQALIVYLENDKTYYQFNRGGGISHVTETLMKELVQTYLHKGGWEIERPSVFEIIIEQERVINIQTRVLEGYVIPEWSKDLKPEDYQGGLSNKLFKEPYLQDYLKGGGCHGYIGHSVRTFKIDKKFEKRAKELKLTDLEIAIFMCGKDGRHFGDSIENHTEDLSIEELKNNLPDYVYSAMKSWLTKERNKILEQRKLQKEEKNKNKKTVGVQN